MAVGLYCRVEKASELILRCWRDVLLVLENNDLMFVQSLPDHFEIGLADVLEVCSLDLSAKVYLRSRSWRDPVDCDFALDSHSVDGLIERSDAGT